VARRIFCRNDTKKLLALMGLENCFARYLFRHFSISKDPGPGLWENITVSITGTSIPVNADSGTL
jgi:hypothetical protein